MIVFIAGRAAAASPVTVLAVVIAAAAAAEGEGGGRLGVAVAEVGDAVLWMQDVEPGTCLSRVTLVLMHGGTAYA